MIDSLRFAAQFLRHPGRTGAIAPSSPVLAKAMVRALGTLPPGQVVVELGPGTGVVTRQLRRLLPHNPLVAVEYCSEFVHALRRQHPDIQVIEGCASQIETGLVQLGIVPGQVAALISGLPFVSLPSELGTSILQALARILLPGRPFVQFTYVAKAPWWHRQPPAAGFSLVRRRKIWLNLPPATVLTFVRNPDPA